MKKLLLIFLLFAGWESARACDCPPETPTESAMRSYDFIFSGKVIAISGCDKIAHVTFSVDELYKGKSFASASLEFDCTSDCQMNFAPGEEWIIYADYVSYGKAKVEFCSLSRKKNAVNAEDFYQVSHGMDYNSEKNLLLKTFGKQTLNIVDQQATQHHELIHPKGMQIIWYLAAGLAGLGLFYFLGKKFLK